MTNTAESLPRHPAVRRGASRRADIGAWAAAAVVVVISVWVVSGGTWSQWRDQGAYYQGLADAFRHGQTYLLDKPAPALLALPDPYDPAANRQYGHHDVSLYGGRFYLYWGPVPALLVAAIESTTAVARIPDAALAFAFACGTLAFGTLLLTRIRRRHFVDAPGWTVPLAVLAVGLATPGPFNLARAAVYEASITASQMFFAAGLYFAAAALDRRAPSRVRLLLAGACFACAVGSRASVALAVAGAWAWITWRVLDADRVRGGSRRRAMVTALMLALPLAGAAGGLAAYNQARFGSPFELGIRYQLAGFNSYKEFGNLTSVHHVLPNLRTYLLAPVPLADLFPFGRPAEPGGGAIAWGLIRLPGYAVGREAPAGLLLVAPFAWFALATFRRSRRVEGVGGEDERFVRWLLSLLGVSVLLLALPALVLIETSSSLRYQADWTTAVLVVAAIGWWQGYRRRFDRPLARRLWLAAGVLFALFTAAAGAILAVTRTPGHFLP